VLLVTVDIPSLDDFDDNAQFTPIITPIFNRASHAHLIDQCHVFADNSAVASRADQIVQGNVLLSGESSRMQ
jgi:hypothetical protein